MPLSRRLTAGLLGVAAATGLALGATAPAQAAPAPAAAPAHVAPALPPGTLEDEFPTQAQCIAAGDEGVTEQRWQTYICTTAGVPNGWYGLYVRNDS